MFIHPRGKDRRFHLDPFPLETPKEACRRAAKGGAVPMHHVPPPQG